MSKPACPGSGTSAPDYKIFLPRGARTAFAALSLFLTSITSSSAQQAPASAAVDVTLVIAVDVSGSIDMGEFHLQREGYVKALTDKRFLNAIKGGDRQAIAVGYFEWTGPGMNAPVYDCTVIRSDADAEAFAKQIESTPRLLYGGGTGVGEAIYAGMAMHDRCGAQPDRRVIDVSGDGRNNRGRRAGPARDEAVKRGITINGLAIINEERDLESYYRAEVMGGQGAFVAVVDDFESFEEAVLAKLVREVSSREPTGAVKHAER